LTREFFRRVAQLDPPTVFFKNSSDDCEAQAGALFPGRHIRLEEAAAAAAERPVRTLLSGPSAGVSGGVQYAQLAGEQYLLPVTLPRDKYYDTGLTVSYDLDLFGGIRRGIEAARADDEAVEAARDLVRARDAVQGSPFTLEELDEQALVSILGQPKNALVKQYRKLFDLDGVALKFTDGALKAIASEAIRRKAGARGLRSILETAMLDVMYDIPSQKTAREVVISEEVILKKSEPVILHATDKDELQKESA